MSCFGHAVAIVGGRGLRPDRKPAWRTCVGHAGLEDDDVECQFTVVNVPGHGTGIAVYGTPLACHAHGLLAIARLFRPRVRLFYMGERESVSHGRIDFACPPLFSLVSAGGIQWARLVAPPRAGVNHASRLPSVRPLRRDYGLAGVATLAAPRLIPRPLALARRLGAVMPPSGAPWLQGLRAPSCPAVEFPLAPRIGARRKASATRRVATLARYAAGLPTVWIPASRIGLGAWRVPLAPRWAQRRDTRGLVEHAWPHAVGGAIRRAVGVESKQALLWETEGQAFPLRAMAGEQRESPSGVNRTGLAVDTVKRTGRVGRWPTSRHCAHGGRNRLRAQWWRRPRRFSLGAA